jgi:hypothetical protein
MRRRRGGRDFLRFLYAAVPTLFAMAILDIFACVYAFMAANLLLLEVLDRWIDGLEAAQDRAGIAGTQRRPVENALQWQGNTWTSPT